jgi:hypothetical protein
MRSLIEEEPVRRFRPRPSAQIRCGLKQLDGNARSSQFHRRDQTGDPATDNVHLAC